MYISIFLHSTFLPYHEKRTILHSKWTLLKSCSFFFISLHSIINLTYDFKSQFLDVEIITISKLWNYHFTIDILLIDQDIYQDKIFSLWKLTKIDVSINHLKLHFTVLKFETNLQNERFRIIVFLVITSKEKEWYTDWIPPPVWYYFEYLEGNRSLTWNHSNNFFSAIYYSIFAFYFYLREILEWQFSI